jgi:probable rRNA maturation factor
MTPAQSIGRLADNESEPPSLLEILIANETNFAIDHGRIESAVAAVFSDSDYDAGTVSVVVVNDPTIRRLNRQFLQHDYATDVISFPLEQNPPRLVGEVIASVDTAKRWAAENGWSTANELLLYVIHGCLHLAGYRDKLASDAVEMRAAERRILEKLGAAPSTADPRWRSNAASEERQS